MRCRTLFGLASGALSEAKALAEGLVVHPERMRANLDITRGLLFADAAAARLAAHLGREEAHALVERAAGIVRDTGEDLPGVLRRLTPHPWTKPSISNLRSAPPAPGSIGPSPKPRGFATLSPASGDLMPLIAANGTQLFYDLTGPEGAPVVVFSNSLGTTVEMWDAQVRALASRYRCLRYDTRGHGRSPTVEAPFSVEDLADDIASLLDALDIAKAHVVGLSLGGMTAQAFAVRHPQRVGGLVLMATAAFLPPKEAWDERVRIVNAKGMGALVDTVMQRWFTPDTLALGPEIVRPVRERFLAIDPKGYAACCRAIRDMDLRPAIGGIAAPTLIVAGEDDPATPLDKAEEILGLVPGAELTVVPEAAHLISVEQPDAVNEILLSFLARVDGEREPSAGCSRRGSRTARACSAWTMCSALSRKPAPLRDPGRTSSPAPRGVRSGATRPCRGRPVPC